MTLCQKDLVQNDVGRRTYNHNNGSFDVRELISHKMRSHPLQFSCCRCKTYRSFCTQNQDNLFRKSKDSTIIMRPIGEMTLLSLSYGIVNGVQNFFQVDVVHGCSLYFLLELSSARWNYIALNKFFDFFFISEFLI